MVAVVRVLSLSLSLRIGGKGNDKGRDVHSGCGGDVEAIGKRHCPHPGGNSNRPGIRYDKTPEAVPEGPTGDSGRNSRSSRNSEGDEDNTTNSNTRASKIPNGKRKEPEGRTNTRSVASGPKKRGGKKKRVTTTTTNTHYVARPPLKTQKRMLVA